MKIINIFRWGLFNVLKKKGNFFHLTISLFIVTSLLSIGLLYTMFVDYLYKDISKKKSDHIVLNCTVSNRYDIDNYYKMREYLKTKSIVSEMRLFSLLDIFGCAESDEIDSLSEGMLHIFIDNTECGETPLDSDSSYINVCFDDTSFFSKYHTKLFNEKFNNLDILKYGRCPQKDNECMVSETFLKTCGLTDNDISDICGKNFSLQLDNYDVLNDFVISGVVREEYFEIAGQYNGIVFVKRQMDQNLLGDNAIVLYFDYYDYDEINTIKKELNYNYYLPLEGNDNYSLLSQLSVQKRVTNRIIYIFESILILCSVLNIIIFLLVILVQNREQIALLVSHGMSMKNLIQLKLTEMYMSVLASSVMSLIFISVLAVIFNNYLYKYYIVQYRIKADLVILAVLLTIIVVSLIITLLYSSMISKLLKNKSIAEIMKL